MSVTVAPDRVAYARRLLDERRMRDTAFGDDCSGFGEPAWDMLLSLFVAGIERPLSANELLDAAGVPEAIGRPYLDWLTTRELAVPDLATSQPGRLFFRIGPLGLDRMNGFFDCDRSALS